MLSGPGTDSSRPIFYNIGEGKSQESLGFPEHTSVMWIKMLAPKKERAKDWASDT